MQQLTMQQNVGFSVIANPNKFEKFVERGQKIK